MAIPSSIKYLFFIRKFGFIRVMFDVASLATRAANYIVTAA